MELLKIIANIPLFAGLTEPQLAEPAPRATAIDRNFFIAAGTALIIDAARQGVGDTEPPVTALQVPGHDCDDPVAAGLSGGEQFPAAGHVNLTFRQMDVARLELGRAELLQPGCPGLPWSARSVQSFLYPVHPETTSWTTRHSSRRQH